MRLESRFKELGKAYLASLEGAIGCRIDAHYPGKTFQLDDLTATMRRFYLDWAPAADGLIVGKALIGGEVALSTLHSAKHIAPPLRDSCRDEAGIFIITHITPPERIRSLLMFADAILFWDPFEDAFRGGGMDSGIAATALANLIPLRPLIAEGLVVPAQLARCRVADEDEAIRSYFEDTLMWEAALGAGEIDRRRRVIADDLFEFDLRANEITAKGYRGHAENKVAGLFLPDLVIPLMGYGSLASYQRFCVALDRGLTAREIEYSHQSLAFETGFILSPGSLDNERLLELRQRDAIFAALRSTILDAVRKYEDDLATGLGSDFIHIFNRTLQSAFADLKARALVSNTWKEFVDERQSFSTRLLAKVSSAPLAGKSLVGDFAETLVDSASTSAGNLIAASLKTYGRYRNTKLLLDFAGAIRDRRRGPSGLSI